jgi:hypothetical protein
MMQASPVVFHSVMISILFHHYKHLMKLKGMRDILLPASHMELEIQQQEGTLDRYCDG